MKENIIIISLLILTNILFLYELFGVTEIVMFFLAFEIVVFSLCSFIESKTHLIERFLEDE